MAQAADHEAQEFRLCPKEGREALMFTALGAALAGVFIVWQNGMQAAIWAVGIFVVISGVQLFLYNRARTDRSVHLRIDAQGIHARAMKPTTVPWSQIARIDFVHPRRSPMMMRVFLGAPEAEAPQAKGMMDALYRSMQVAAINLAVEDLEGDHRDIAAAIARFSPSTQVAL